MGTSTNGQIAYGVLLEEDAILPWESDNGTDIDDWWLGECGFIPKCQPFTEEGEYAEGFGDNDPRIKEYFKDRREFLKSHPMPFDLVNVCSGEYPIYMLAVPNTLLLANRGYPEKIDLNKLSQAIDTNELTAFLNKYEIDFGAGFSWYLSSCSD